MRDAGIRIFLAADLEACTFIEGNGMGLRREPDRVMAALTAQMDSRCEQGAADAASAPGFAHGHAADDIGFKDSGASYRLAIRVQRQQMNCRFIQPVPFQLGRHLLFINENLGAYAAQSCLFAGPVDYLDGE